MTKENFLINNFNGEIPRCIKEKKSIEDLIYRDYLTNLHSRQDLFRIYTLLKNDIKIKNLVIFILDLDELKNINNCFGHDIGDLIIKLVSDKLSDVCKNRYIARVDGDEFVIIYENLTDIKKIESISKKILSSLNKISIDKVNLYGISASMGIAIGNNNEKNLCKLLIKANLALHKAKRLGKNTSVLFTPDLEEEKRLKTYMINDLMNDIKNNKNVSLHYQPQYTCDKKLISFESLFRWNNKKYYNIPICEIINIIEKTKYFDEFNDYIITNALSFAKEINKNRKKKIIVSINISAKHLMKDNFINKFLDMLKEFDIPYNIIGIELTETVLLNNLTKTINKLQKLKDLGVLIYLDDFGTGYSSLNYLISLPLSIVKIDKYFIWQTDKGKKYIEILKSIIKICHTLNLPIVAEGVETTIQLNLLKKLNVDYIQGYLFSKPLPKNEAYNLVAKN